MNAEVDLCLGAGGGLVAVQDLHDIIIVYGLCDALEFNSLVKILGCGDPATEGLVVLGTLDNEVQVGLVVDSGLAQSFSGQSEACLLYTSPSPRDTR